MLKMESCMNSQAVPMFQELPSSFACLLLVYLVPQSDKCACYVSDILLPQRSIRHWPAFKELIFLVEKLTYGQTHCSIRSAITSHVHSRWIYREGSDCHKVGGGIRTAFRRR